MPPSTPDALAAARWADALEAAAILALDPARLGGAVLRGSPGPVRDRWLALLRAALPAGAPWLRVPAQVPEARLLGGLDLAATLAAGRPLAERGLLAAADGGVLLLATAERLSPTSAALIAAALDQHAVQLARDGLSGVAPARCAALALDEGRDDERLPTVLRERLALHLDLDALGPRAVTLDDTEDAAALQAFAARCAAARAALPAVQVDDAALQALCATTLALGIASLRAPLQALQVARAAAALAGRDAVATEDLALAARLVLAPRATQLPAPPEAAEAPPPPPDSDADAATDTPRSDDGTLDDVVLAAARAALPAGLLLQLQGMASAVRAGRAGRAGAVQRQWRRGRAIGSRRGDPRTGARLHLLDTLRAAAPWQTLRRRERAASASPQRLDVRRDDFRVTRFQQRRQTTSIFVVDASGSSALHRLAEAKGAVELLLADCYVRRDEVALIAFRGTQAEVVLPPTRSLPRAKRALAGLPGGGATPLAHALDCTAALVDAVQRQGATPVVILLTDGRANIARDGNADRPRAAEDALAAARRCAAAGATALLLDTSPRPQPFAAELAAALHARYLALPHADAQAMARAAQQAGTVGR